MKKRVLVLLLTVIMLFGMGVENFTVTAQTATPTIRLESVETERGQTVSLKVFIENNPGVWGMDIKIAYDKTALTLTSVENGDFYQTPEWTKGNLNADVYILSYEAGDFANITTQAGTLATLNFRVSDTAPGGNYAVNATYDAGDIINIDFEDIQFSVVNGAVSVACSHPDKTETLPRNPDCVTPGNNRYYTCNACGDVFKADGVTETTVENEMIPALGHDFSEKIEDTAHLVSGSGGNCQEVKAYYYDCIRCDAIGTAAFDGTTTGEHQMESAWTSENGKHYHKCSASACAYIEDEASCFGGTATCRNKAVCAACGQEYGALGECDFTGEKPEAKYLKQEATCQAAAVYYKSCSVCGKAGTETFSYGETDSGNHTGSTEVRDAVEASCTADGYTGDTWCTGCDTKLETGTVVSSGHKLEMVAYAPATHEAAGNEAHYFCSGCNKLFADELAASELTADEVIIPQGEHDYGDDYCADENNHWKECECGSKSGESAHSYGAWETVLQPAADAKGSRERICSVCGYTQTDEIPAISTPTTGDNGQLVLWMTLMLLSACGVVGLVLGCFHKRGKYLK